MTPSPKGGQVPISRRVMNLAHFVRQNARRLGTEIAFVHGPAVTTWATLDHRIDALATALLARGITKGDRVLVQSRNCQQMFETMFACFRTGAVYVPTNFRQSPDEVAFLAQASGATTLVCHADFPVHAQVLSHLPTIVIPGIIGAAPFGTSYEALIAEHESQTIHSADVEHDDPAWFFFTSGTTGRPKASVLTHGQLAFVVNNHLADLMPGTTHADASLCVAPLSHGAGVHQLVQTARGVKTILPEGDRFDVEQAWSLVEKWRVTNMFTVPTIVKLLTEHPAAATADKSSLRYIIYAGAPMYREDQKHALTVLGPVLVQYFGLGEVTGNITVFPPGLHDLDDTKGRPGTCGYERTGIQISIQDDQGQERAPFETGEICVCGPAVFAGYYDNPEANAKAFRNGWFRTGDLGHMDAQGFLFITGRASDMYISGGSNVYPREIEEKLLTHPAIAEVAIVGVPDRTWGEVGIAAVVLRPGASLDEPTLLAWLEPHVARYKRPRRIVFWDDLPKSAYGKITKKAIRQELEARGQLGTST